VTGTGGTTGTGGAIGTGGTAPTQAGTGGVSSTGGSNMIATGGSSAIGTGGTTPGNPNPGGSGGAAGPGGPGVLDAGPVVGGCACAMNPTPLSAQNLSGTIGGLLLMLLLGGTRKRPQRVVARGSSRSVQR